MIFQEVMNHYDADLSIINKVFYKNLWIPLLLFYIQILYIAILAFNNKES